MRIGVVSDTHNHLRNVGRIVELFNEERVDRVIHTGDITQAKVLHAFSKLDAPLFGVYGNNDQERDTLEAAVTSHGFVFVDPPLRVTWHGVRLVVVHEPPQLEAIDAGDYDVALHGHTHMRRIEHQGECLIFNPGECAGHMPGHNAVGVLDLNTLEPLLLHF